MPDGGQGTGCPGSRLTDRHADAPVPEIKAEDSA